MAIILKGMSDILPSQSSISFEDAALLKSQQEELKLQLTYRDLLQEMLRMSEKQRVEHIAMHQKNNTLPKNSYADAFFAEKPLIDTAYIIELSYTKQRIKALRKK